MIFYNNLLVNVLTIINKTVMAGDQHLLIWGFYAFKKLNQAFIQLRSISCGKIDGGRVFLTL